MTSKLKLWTSRGWQPSMISRTAVLQQLKQVLTLSKPQPSLTDQEVPAIFREPHIETGYRVPNKPWTYYVASLFELHNETVNVWSHLVGFFIFLYKVIELASEVDLLNDPMTWPLLGFCFGVMSYAVLSSLAHLMHSQSEPLHFFWFQIDYVGIGMNCTGTGIYLYYLVGTKSFYQTFGSWFLIINCLSGILACISCSISKLFYRRPYPFTRKLWMMGPVLFSLLFSAIPLAYKTYEGLTGQTDLDETLTAHYISIAVFGVAAFFFSCHYPEMLSPRTFDIFGHAHSVFHIFMTMASMLQFDAALLEYRTKSADIRQMLNPTFMTVFGFQILVLVVDLVYVFCTNQARTRRVAENQRFEAKEKEN